jgi:recombination protein RecA
MAKTALATLESALRAKKLDRTLTSALPAVDRQDALSSAPSSAPTGVAALDACLRSGVPRGQLSELAGPRSSGRTTLMLQLMAAATERGELVAVIDTFDRLDVASVVAAGVDVTRLLWVRGQAISKTEGAVDSRWTPGDDSTRGFSERGLRGSPGQGLVERTIDRGLKALNLVLQAGGFGVVALDLADVPIATLKRIPYPTWLRVQRTIEGRDTACVLVVPEPLARSAGGLTLSLTGRTSWAGDADRSRRVAGAELEVRIVSPRRRDGGVVCVSGHTDSSGGVSPGAVLPRAVSRRAVSPRTVSHRVVRSA